MSRPDPQPEARLPPAAGTAGAIRSVVPEVRVLYGSEMGSAEYLADDLAAALEEHGIPSRATELDTQPIETLGGLGIALIIVSTYGEGEMPYGAEDFWERLDADDAPSCAGLRYAVLALGDSSYTYFCEAGVLIDARLAQLGATRLADRVDCDSDYRVVASAWIRERVAQLRATRSIDPVEEECESVHALDSAPPTAQIPDSESAQARASHRWSREHPFAARLTEAIRLSGADSGKEVMHYEIELRGSGIELHPGDALGVIPTNDPYAVDRFLEAARVPGWERLEGRTLRFLAGEQWELRFPSAALLEEIATHAPESLLGSLVAGGDRAAIGAWIATHCVADAIKEFPDPVSPQQLGEMMRPMRYRAYSVASSMLAHPEAMQLTVATQRPGKGSSMRSGVASGFLADRVIPGDEVRVFPIPNRSFRLPEDDALPIIMIGPGVGVAPFRAFLQEREASRAPGASWLFFGDRHEETDFIYRDDWERFRSNGTLTRLDTAFSRDQDERVYVQTRMRESSAELARWLQGGAVVYVCGDAQRMAGDVEECLHAILVEQLGLAEGSELWAAIREEKRYRLDVY